MIRRALISAREKFGLQPKDFNVNQPDIQQIEVRRRAERREKTHFFFFRKRCSTSTFFVLRTRQDGVRGAKARFTFANAVRNSPR